MPITSVLENENGPSGWAIYSLPVEHADQIVSALPTGPGQHFVLFLAWDARATSDDAIFLLARGLVRAGLAYIVAWGPDCQRVHDIFDAADIEENPESNVPDTEAVIMSTWHDSEPLEEALWFAVHSAYPAPPYDTACMATIVVTVGNSGWASSVRRYLGDLSALDRVIGVSDT